MKARAANIPLGWYIYLRKHNELYKRDSWRVGHEIKVYVTCLNFKFHLTFLKIVKKYNNFRNCLIIKFAFVNNLTILVLISNSFDRKDYHSLKLS